MSSYIIKGGKKLYGEVKLQGAKNAALPIMAACVLNNTENILYNVPKIKDVSIMIKILRSIGCKVIENGDCLIIDSSTINSVEVSEQLVRKMRSSIMVMGALLSKHNETRFSYPGGCDIGLRPIDIHLKGLRALGAEITEEHGYIVCTCSSLKGTNILLDYPSVGATENIMLAAVYAEGVTSISNAAKEPEIVDLQEFLNHMGARVYGAGTNTIYVEGVKHLSKAEYKIMSDRIVAGTYLCAVNTTGGKVFIQDGTLDNIKAVYYKLIETGCEIKQYSDGLMVKSNGNIQAIDTLITLPYPGFPTDLQPVFTAMLTYAKGSSIINETIFESRYKFATQLIRMGANIKIEGRLAIITGMDHLSSATLYSPDLRGGAALCVAALRADGESRLEDVEYIERGYENFVDNFTKIGASIYYR